MSQIVCPKCNVGSTSSFILKVAQPDWIQRMSSPDPVCTMECPACGTTMEFRACALPAFLPRSVPNHVERFECIPYPTSADWDEGQLMQRSTWGNWVRYEEYAKIAEQADALDRALTASRRETQLMEADRDKAWQEHRTITEANARLTNEISDLKTQLLNESIPGFWGRQCANLSTKNQALISEALEREDRYLAKQKDLELTTIRLKQLEGEHEETLTRCEQKQREVSYLTSLTKELREKAAAKDKQIANLEEKVAQLQRAIQLTEDRCAEEQARKERDQWVREQLIKRAPGMARWYTTYRFNADFTDLKVEARSNIDTAALRADREISALHETIVQLKERLGREQTLVHKLREALINGLVAEHYKA